MLGKRGLLLLVLVPSVSGVLGSDAQATCYDDPGPAETFCTDDGTPQDEPTELDRRFGYEADRPPVKPGSEIVTGLRTRTDSLSLLFSLAGYHASPTSADMNRIAKLSGSVCSQCRERYDSLAEAAADVREHFFYDGLIALNLRYNDFQACVDISCPLTRAQQNDLGTELARLAFNNLVGTSPRPPASSGSSPPASTTHRLPGSTTHRLPGSTTHRLPGSNRHAPGSPHACSRFCGEIASSCAAVSNACIEYCRSVGKPVVYLLPFPPVLFPC